MKQIRLDRILFFLLTAAVICWTGLQAAPAENSPGLEKNGQQKKAIEISPDKTSEEAARTVSGKESDVADSGATVSEKKGLELTQEELLEQDELLRAEVMGFVKENADRQAGEGWLYLAHHYRELKEPERSLMYLRTLRRAEHINPRLVWEAILLNAEILKEQKEFAAALKDLDQLIAMVPARIYLVRAKIARAELLGRSLTDIKELWAAFYRYYQGFPEKPDVEAIQYLMGFERGYDLEIAMKALTAWEEIAKFPEVEASNLALLHIAMLHAFDLNNPARAVPYLQKIAEGESVTADAAFLMGVIRHFYLKNDEYKVAIDDYSLFRKKTESLEGYRIAGILQGQLLTEQLADHDAAVNTLQTLLETPPHLVASESFSLLRRRELRDEEIDWAMLACRMAGYI